MSKPPARAGGQPHGPDSPAPATGRFPYDPRMRDTDRPGPLRMVQMSIAACGLPPGTSATPTIGMLRHRSHIFTRSPGSDRLPELKTSSALGHSRSAERPLEFALAALVAVVDDIAGVGLADRHVQRVEHELRAQMVGIAQPTIRRLLASSTTASKMKPAVANMGMISATNSRLRQWRQSPGPQVR